MYKIHVYKIHTYEIHVYEIHKKEKLKLIIHFQNEYNRRNHRYGRIRNKQKTFYCKEIGLLNMNGEVATSHHFNLPFTYHDLTKKDQKPCYYLFKHAIFLLQSLASFGFLAFSKKQPQQYNSGCKS